MNTRMRPTPSILSQTRAIQPERASGSPEVDPDKALQDLTALAASLCQCPMAAVSYRSETGGDQLLASAGFSCVSPSADSFTAQVLAHSSAFFISDVSEDPRLSKHPWVKEDPKIRYFAGAPIHGLPALPAAVLCVFDIRPRQISEQHLQILQALASQAHALLELKKARLELRRAAIGRRLLEATLHELQEQYSVTFDSAQVGIVHVDLRGRFIRANDMFCSLVGYDRDELMLLSVEHINHPEDYRRDSPRIFELLDGGLDFYRVDKRYIRKDGRIVWASLVTRLQRDSSGKPSYFFTIAQDISDKKLAEQALIESESRLRWVFNNAAVGIILTDPTRRFLDSNVTFVQMMGYSREELCRMRVDEIVHPDDLEVVRRVSIRLRGEGEQPIQVEVRLFSKTGQAIWTRITISLGHNPKELTAPAMAIIEDITARKEVERKIAEHQFKLVAASKMSALGEMSGGIAHEINNPLTIIHGKAIQIQRMTGKPEPDLGAIRSSAEKIESTSLRISKIVKALRSFSRDAENDLFEEIPVQKVVEETLEFCRERLKNHEVELQIDSVPSSLLIECRPVQISQVLLNLLNNAHDAVEGLPRKWVRLTVSDHGGSVDISVTDSGPGIPEELRDKIMQPFFTTKELGKGTGLGLSVSKGIVESHRGSLQLDTDWPNTRFIMRLPKRMG